MLAQRSGSRYKGKVITGSGDGINILDNFEAASVLAEIAELLEIDDQSTFRIRAYERAAQIVRGLPNDINDLDRENRLTEISGIGGGIADKLHELLTTGRMEYLEELKSRVPETLTQLVHVPGLGPKKAKLVFDELGITTLDELKEAIADKKLRSLPGMGAKTEENIARGIQVLEKFGGRLLLNEALPAAERVLDYLRGHREVKRVDTAGSLRRHRETIGDIDLLCATDRPRAAADIFCGYPEVDTVIAKGETKCSVRLTDGLQIDLRLIKPEQYGAALQYFTGSKAHNIHLRELAGRSGFKLSEYGVFNIETGKSIAGRDEIEVYNTLGLEWMEPELREDRGEIEAAIRGELPDLVRLKDIQGDLHVHTRASDGQSDLQEMADYAMGLGYSYMAVSDHAIRLKIAGGLSQADFEKQWREVDKINEELEDFKILKGVELNIDNDGRVDFPAEFLKRYDIVTASIHAGFGQDIAEITARMTAAAENPDIDVIGHPTGRLLGRRQPYAVDLAAVFKAAARSGTLMELNAFPDRLDLDDVHLIEAKKAGCRIAINTDAHHFGQLSFMRYGIYTARRGWLEAEDIVNTWPLKKLERWLRDKNG